LTRLDDPARTIRREDMWMLNVWASWCAACRDEHPHLLDFARTKQLPMLGVNYKDTRHDGLVWLARFGNPYDASLFDGDGRVVRFKQVGAIADSHAGLAEDLRRELREQLQRGASDEQVLQFMTQRYGGFVRYRPPLEAGSVVLWAGPAAMLLGGLGVLAVVLRRRARLAAQAFDAHADADGDEGAAPR
jgi:Cytochrome C biogenesis protein